MSEADFRLRVLIAVKLAPRDCPWSLLTGAEKGRRPREEEERRAQRLAERIADRLALRRTSSGGGPSSPLRG